MYAFTLVVSGIDQDNEFQSAGLDCLSYDVLVSSSNGRTTLDVEIDAASPTDALDRIYDDVRSINGAITRVDLDLVGISDVAERLNATRQAVRLWSNGERRSDFPNLYTTIGDSKVWAWADVYSWARSNALEIDEFYSGTPIPVDIAETFNGAFARQRAIRAQGWIPGTLTTGTSKPVASRRPTSNRTGWREVRPAA